MDGVTAWALILLLASITAVVLLVAGRRIDYRIARRVAEITGAELVEVDAFRPSSGKTEITVKSPDAMARLLGREKIRRIYVVRNTYAMPRYVVETDNYYVWISPGVLKASVYRRGGVVSYAD